jgi:rubredoxin
LAEKTCPDCAEMVKAEARVCRFCGYRFDLAEAEQRRAEEASLTGWQRLKRAIESSAGREPAPRVRTNTPASC